MKKKFSIILNCFTILIPINRKIYKREGFPIVMTIVMITTALIYSFPRLPAFDEIVVEEDYHVEVGVVPSFIHFFKNLKKNVVMSNFNF